MFAVDWEVSASQDFAVISMRHTDRWKDINAADNDIDAKLRQDPLNTVSRLPKDSGVLSLCRWQSTFRLTATRFMSKRSGG